MEKVLLLLCLLIFANSLSYAQGVTISEEWEFSERKENMPHFIANPTYGARGMGVGSFNGSKVVVIPALTPSTAVHVLNADNGTAIGTLNMAGVSGGTVAVSDAAVTSDGKILVSNLITKGGDIFKVYQWDNPQNQSKIAISYELLDKTGRYGDHITVTGSIADGTAKVFTATEISDGRTYKILCFHMIEDGTSPGNYIFNQVPEVVSASITISTSPRPLRPSVAILPNGNLIHKGKGTQLIEIGKDGTRTGNLISKDILTENALSPQYISIPDQELLIGVYNDDLKCSSLVSIKNNDWNNASVVLNTPSLGKRDNGNGTGRIHIDTVNETIYLYVLSTNNGVGKYKIIL